MQSDRYLAALERELQIRSGEHPSAQYGTIYIGGGTPTTLNTGQLSRLLDSIERHITTTRDAEFTAEANPNSASAEKLSLLHARGVNRLSIGAQSFSDTVLAALGRSHTVQDTFTAFHTARSVGFVNIGIDLIYGIPGQTEQQWMQTIDSALSLRPEHLSLYSLSLDEGSRLSRAVLAGRVSLPEDETTARMYLTAILRLAAAGYLQYEISNFCVPGLACRHNTRYWDRGEYLGFGPAASSFLGNRRFTTIADVNEYASRMEQGLDAIGAEEILSRDQEASEMLFLGLRKTAGIDLARYSRIFGKAAGKDLKARLDMHEASGLFRIEGSMLKLSTKGFLLSNEALAAILP